MASSPPLIRRFKPEPVESSHTSSKRSALVTNMTNRTAQVTSTAHDSAPSEQSNDMAPQAKPRRFLPQPVEESERSSRKKKVVQFEQTNFGQSASPPQTDDATVSGVPRTKPEAATRRFAPQPVETSSISSRRKFAPEAVETSSTSSKNKLEDTRPRRRFAPEPVESSVRNSKGKEQEQDTSKPRRKFAPEPVETTSTTRRRKAPEPASKHEFDDFAAEDGPAGSRKFTIEPVEISAVSRRRKAAEPKPAHDYVDYTAEDGPGGSPPNHDPPSRASSGGRRFSPELIETAKGRYRHSLIKSPTRVKPKPKSPRPEEENDDVAPIEESRFSAAALAKKHHKEQRQERKQSLMVPALSTIESDSGDDSEAPSLTNSRSSAESEQRQNGRRAQGATYIDYVLRLAAQGTELKEHAMAAYINERHHEPVAHFAFDDEDEPFRVGKLSGQKGVDPRTFRRSSQDDLDWEMGEMRRHHAQLEAAKSEFKHDTVGVSRFSAAALASRRHVQEHKEDEAKKKKKVKAAKEDEENEFAKMRKAASPPMLGSDLTFPFTVSPKMTRCDVDHAPRPRTQESGDGIETEGGGGMWGVKVKVKKEAGAGLWGGFCAKGEGEQERSRPVTPVRSGLQTPANERTNPFDSAPVGRRTPGKKGKPGGLNWLAMSSITATTAAAEKKKEEEDVFTSTIDKKLQLERQIEEEFPDRVVVQIYNYLSLGYPTLAWAFDEELAKISRISVDDLRKDDELMDAKGYVGVPESVQGTLENDVNGNGGNGACRRFEALRLYVREWARQSPGFMEGNWSVKRGKGWGGGAAARRGSWGN